MEYGKTRKIAFVAAFVSLTLTFAGAGCVESRTAEKVPSATPPPATDDVSVPVPVVPAQASFGAAIAMRVGESVAYEDGLVVRLKAINDSRCPAGAQCIWAGELSPVLEMSGGSLAGATELVLGTMTGDTKSAGTYQAKVEDVTESSVLLVIAR